MKKYGNLRGERLGGLVYRIENIMMHFQIGAKQLSGKEELIEILTKIDSEDLK